MTISGQVLPLIRVRAVPLPEIPEFPGVLEALRKKYPLDGSARRVPGAAAADLSDPRVRAVFQVPPGVGRLVTAESLASVRVPVGIRWGGADTVNPYEVDTRPYLEHIPTASGRSAGRQPPSSSSTSAEPRRTRRGDPALSNRLRRRGTCTGRVVPVPA